MAVKDLESQNNLEKKEVLLGQQNEHKTTEMMKGELQLRKKQGHCWFSESQTVLQMLDSATHLNYIEERELVNATSAVNCWHPEQSGN